MIIDNEFRSHYCGKLDTSNVGEEVKLSGWMHSIRDHGGLVFIDLRDQFGFTQIVIDQQSTIFKKVENNVKVNNAELTEGMLSIFLEKIIPKDTFTIKIKINTKNT